MNEKLQQEFAKLYSKEPSKIYFAPGRVNLIGEHIDYNGGLVMPCAITLGTYMLAAPNDDNIFRFKSLNFKEEAAINIDTNNVKIEEFWYNYPVGVLEHFKMDGKTLQGLDILYYGNIPIASGLSSSASIEVVSAFAFNDIFGAGYSKLEMVKLAKWVENTYIGLQSGIMDQFAVAFGEKDKALMLNCDTLDYQAVDSSLGEYVLAIINTNKSRKLAESKYNERVTECQAALKALQTALDINYLCDIDSATFNSYKHLITDEVVRNRATHVIEENDRVKLAAKALSSHNLPEFGQLMYASHQSLRTLYEVSGKELDAVVDFCKTQPYVAGARMTGAGFGGCAIALVKADQYDHFSEAVTEYYTKEIGYAPAVYSSLIGDGVGVLTGDINFSTDPSLELVS
ncbi:galactokinase [Mucilaginibacter sp. PAMC 26640]|nr:galactokinase [Mucilaginibacter sp. PAMC 26640]